MSHATAFWLSGSPVRGDTTLEVRSPWDDRLVGTVSLPDRQQVEQAVSDLEGIGSEAESAPAHVRSAALDHISSRLREEIEPLSQLITDESGKPFMWAHSEVLRAAATFRWAAEETRRFSGSVQRLDTEPGSTGRFAVVRRFPRGPVLAISPFNFPLNLVAHKLAPALAVGAPVLVKPAPATPLSALFLGQLVAETTLPPAMVSVLPMTNDRMAGLVADPRLPVISFTGSDRVGWAIREQAPRKHMTLELGGNAAAVIAEDWTDLDGAAARVALFGNYQAGQSCISVQRVLVHDRHYDPFVRALVTAVERLRTGDPSSPDVQVGPVIDAVAADRIESLLDDAIARGASVLTGGGRRGNTIEPTILADLPREAALATEEVFGPVLIVSRFATIDQAFTEVNDSRYGLQAGVFTRDVQVAFRAHRALKVGGVVIGDVPSFRTEQMPYGGWKDSGTGREGVRAAMEDLTDVRVLVLTDLDL